MLQCLLPTYNSKNFKDILIKKTRLKYTFFRFWRKSFPTVSIVSVADLNCVLDCHLVYKKLLTHYFSCSHLFISISVFIHVKRVRNSENRFHLFSLIKKFPCSTCLPNSVFPAYLVPRSAEELCRISESLEFRNGRSQTAFSRLLIPRRRIVRLVS